MKFAHPFGRDYSLDIALNPVGLAKLNLLAQTTLPLHVEIESGLFPYGDLGWLQPQAGDSIAVAGDWIVDCGNPPGLLVATTPEADSGWATEIHPPTFIALARPTSSLLTDSVVMINPYRPTQLYNTDPTLSTVLNDCGPTPPPGIPPPCSMRIQDKNTTWLQNEIVYQFLPNAPTPAAFHELIAATQVGTIVWNVCAPRPRPLLAHSVGFNYKFIVRSGVSVSLLNNNAATGCIQLMVQEAPSQFVPASLDALHDTWNWNQRPPYDAEGFPDINQTFGAPPGGCTQPGAPQPCTIQAFLAALLKIVYPESLPKAYIAPSTDRYDALHAVAARLDSTVPTVIPSDAQPFPMTGHVQVWWATTAPPTDPCQSIRDQLSNLNQTDFNSYTAFEAEFDKLELQLRECVSNAKNHPPVNSL